MMGYGFNKSGHFELWNDIFTFNSEEELEVLEKMPVPNGYKIEITDKTSKEFIKEGVNNKITEINNKPSIDITNEVIDFGLLTSSIDKKQSIETINNNLKEGNDIIINFLNLDALKLISKVLSKVKDNNVNINWTTKLTPENTEKYNTDLEFLVTIINAYNNSKEFNSKKFASTNAVVSGIKEIISSPLNQVYANKPVDIKPLHNGAKFAMEEKLERREEFKKKKIKEFKGKKLTNDIIKEVQDVFKVNLYKSASFYKNIDNLLNEAERLSKLSTTLSSHDIISGFKQQMDAIVGKADVGIGANGQKVLLTLTDYYNNYYSKLTKNKDGKLVDESGNKVDIHNDPKWFIKTFDMGSLGVSKRTTIADTAFDQDLYNTLLEGYNYAEWKDILKIINNGEAALYISGFISGATDNAKELVMAKINAIESLAAMHLYLMALGYTAKEVAQYMNNDLVSYVVETINDTNIFSNKKIKYVEQIVKDYKEIYKDNEKIKSQADTFLDIYNGSKEFSSLASILKVNQRTSADVENIYLFLNKLNNAINTREHSILNLSLKSLRRFDTGKDSVISDNNQKDISKLIEVIMEKHPSGITEEYVRRVLTEASSIDVLYIDENGETKSKNVSMLGGQFDVRYFILEENKEYKRIAIDYYNLFKNTINIFDVIAESKHFGAMISGVAATHVKAMKSSRKYNFVFNKLVDILQKKSEEIYTENKKSKKINTFLGNPAFKINLDKWGIKRAIRTYDNYVIANWLKTSIPAGNFTFNVRELLEIANKKSIDLYTSNSAKSNQIGEGSFIKTFTKDDNLIVDLNSDYGIANFKRIMEQLILPILKNKSAKTNLGEFLRLRTVSNPYNLKTTQITATFGLSSLFSEVNLAKFQQLLTAFNNVDRDIEDGLRIKNKNGKELSYRDLFYLYNLIVNDEAVGDKRLTSIFVDYANDENNIIMYDYLEYSKAQDTHSKNVFNINVDNNIKNENEKNALLDRLKDSQENDIIFSILHNKGSLRLKDFDKQSRWLVLKNPDFIINTFMDVSNNKDIEKYSKYSSLLSLLRDTNLLIKYKC